MTENLRLEFDGTSVTGLTADDSDVASTYTASNPLIISATQPYNQASTNRYDWGVAAETDMNQSTVDRWLSRSTKVGSVWSTETTPVTSVSNEDLTGEDQKAGVFYNWYTATAGTGDWTITSSGVTATSSVCPKGWYLPRYDEVGSWAYLIRDTYHLVSTGGNQSTLPDGNVGAEAALHDFPFSIPYAGSIFWKTGATNNQATNGDYWSAGSGSISQLYARGFRLYTDTVALGPNVFRLYGFSIRCLAKQPTTNS